MLLRKIAAVGGAFLGLLLTLASAAEREAGPPVVRHVSDVALPVDAETLNRQYHALSSMPSVRVVYSALGPVRSVEGDTGMVLSSATRSLNEGQAASEILSKFKDVLLAAGSETLEVRWNQMSSTRQHRFISMDQFINGIPVLYGGVSVRIEEGTGLVESLGATFLPDRGLPRQPKLSEADAAKRVAQYLVERGGAKPGSVETSTPTLAYTGTHPDSTRGHLVWAVPARYRPASDDRFEDGIFWIDAVDGEYVGRDALSKESLQVYTANNARPDPANFPAGLTLLFSHPGSSTDQIAMNAYNNMLDSLQGAEVVGSWLQFDPLSLVLHYDSNLTNATYNRRGGVDYIRFGDGSAAASIGPLGNSRDVVAHELGHGVARAMFDPFGGEPSDAQSGAIDEGFGDVIAAVVDTYKRPGVADATWTIGEIWTNDPTRGIRSMSNPKSMSASARDWFPARRLGPDGVTRHTNSTIMSHAFKLLANPPTGGFHARQGQPVGDGFGGTIPSLFVPGLGHGKTWRIFFDTFRDPSVRTFPDFIKVKAAAVATANRLYGAFEADAVDRAFRAVGVGHNCSAPPQSPQLEAVDLCRRWMLQWSGVPGATSYHAQRNPAAWGWANPLTVADGSVNGCMQQVSTYTHARVRACNGCGCSDWSNIVYMWKWPQCP